MLQYGEISLPLVYRNHWEALIVAEASVSQWPLSIRDFCVPLHVVYVDYDVLLCESKLNPMWFSRSDIVYAAAQRQRLSRILPGASTSRNNPTVSPPKGHCKVVAAMIISRLDYCNSVFAGLPADQIARLQRIQNNAARLVMKEKNRDQFTSLLSKNFTGYLWNFAASIRSRLWPIAISKGLYLRIFISLHLSTIPVSPIFQRKVTQNPQAKPEIFWGTFF